MSRKSYAEQAAYLADWIDRMGVELPGPESAQEKALTFFASEIAGGQNLPDFLESQALEWPIFSAWIRKDEVRNNVFKAAMRDRKVIRAERLIDGWWRTAQLQVEERASHADVHRARMALAQAEGVFKGLEGNVGGVTIRFDSVDEKA